MKFFRKKNFENLCFFEIDHLVKLCCACEVDLTFADGERGSSQRARSGAGRAARDQPPRSPAGGRGVQDLRTNGLVTQKSLNIKKKIRKKLNLFFL